MGLIDFIKGAGAKIFGSEPSAEEKAEKKAAAEAKAGDALENLVRKMQIPIDNLDVKYSQGTASIFGTAEKQEIAEKAVLTVGNVNGISQVDNQIEVVNAEPEADYYTVQKGDWLSKIAQKHYGDAKKYNLIFEANKPMLQDPDKIYPGQVLRIPKLG
ncbi:peptidoglycan-binding protein LysM [Fulvivirgaceae bacterium BMA12]|uniref:Peptidoglycan-binding protein LysM n=1 Tax=Agaribacillus aureus TaxID=3051825 RepID=A0ABT8LAN8_9BACT|nr:peptidoglycan-binding protein LysM [Fulvivirgaceae bacterium BMA12]